MRDSAMLTWTQPIQGEERVSHEENQALAMAEACDRLWGPCVDQFSARELKNLPRFCLPSSSSFSISGFVCIARTWLSWKTFASSRATGTWLTTSAGSYWPDSKLTGEGGVLRSSSQSRCDTWEE